jgi:fatty acid desaturase
LAGIGLSILLSRPLIAECWLLPLFLIAAPAHVLIELPEHVGCQPDTTDVFRNTRSIQAGAFARWYTNGNNYHAEHHYRRSIQVEHWSTMHQMLKARVEFLEPSYWSFYRRFLHALRAGVVNDSAYWRTQPRPNDFAEPGLVSRPVEEPVHR